MTQDFHHGQPPDTMTRSVMRAPVTSCDPEDLLADALHQMLAGDIQRPFAHDAMP